MSKGIVELPNIEVAAISNFSFYKNNVIFSFIASVYFKLDAIYIYFDVACTNQEIKSFGSLPSRIVKYKSPLPVKSESNPVLKALSRYSDSPVPLPMVSNGSSILGLETDWMEQSGIGANTSP